MRSWRLKFKLWLLAALVSGPWVFGGGVALASTNGIAGYSGATGSNCGLCHNGGTAPTVTLSGPATLGVGATGSYALTLVPAGGMMGGMMNGYGGLDVAASGGTLATSASGTKLLSGEVVQSSASTVPAAGKTWTFTWTAPTAPGTYTLYGAAASTDGNGNMGMGGDGTAATTLAVTVSAVNQPPVASIGGPGTAVEGASVTFSGSGSSDPDGSIAAYDWNFGDGTVGAGASVSHTYAAGTYTVTLTVTDNGGATGSATQTITVTPANQPQPPVADPVGPNSGTMGGSLQFNGSGSTDPDGSIVTYLWDFGDGTTASTASPTHTFATAGTYTVKLTVTDNTGLTGSAQTTVTVTVPPPDPPPATGGDGAGLYGQYCASCHGAMGQHGSAGSVAGDDAEDIAEAIREVPDMWTLKGVLTTEQIQAIATYLASADGGMDRGDDDDRDGSGKKDKKKKCKDGTKSKNKKKCKKPKRRDDD